MVGHLLTIPYLPHLLHLIANRERIADRSGNAPVTNINVDDGHLHLTGEPVRVAALNKKFPRACVHGQSAAANGTHIPAI